ncbi:MAG: glycosyltransferase family 39 protein [Elusimicrobiota bacterium]
MGLVASITENKKLRTVITVGFFAIIFIIALNIYDDYGISLDEYVQHRHAYVAESYILNSILPAIKSFEIFEGVPSYPQYDAKNYGVLFHLPALIIERMFYLDIGTPALWKFKHLYTFMWFFFGLIFLYKLIKKKYGWGLGLLGCLFMMLSPRIFAHSFYNVKDLVFLSVTIIVIYFSFRFFEQKNLANAILLALFIAISINVRVIGIMFLFMVFIFTIIDWMKTKDNISKKQYTSLAVLLIIAPLLTIAFWPASWENPIKFLIDTIFLKANYSKWGGSVLYMGNFIKAQELPWHYIPVWLGITTPVIYLFLFFSGLLVTVKKFFANNFTLYNNVEEKEDLFLMLAFFIPLLAVIILGSTLYDGWRHLFFIYVPFILISIKGLKHLYHYFETLNLKKCIYNTIVLIFCSLFILGIGHTSFWMVKNHPYQYVYFNILAGNNIEYNYERDYWYLSARKGLEYIVRNDDRDHIKIFKPIGFGKLNIVMLNKHNQKRIEWVDIDEADYVIECFRWVKGNCRPGIGFECNEKEVYSVTVDSFKIMAVYDIRPNS